MYNSFYFRFRAGTTGITSRPSRIVGATSLSTIPSDCALRKMLFSEREMLPIVLANSRRIRASSADALSFIFHTERECRLFSDELWKHCYVSCQPFQTRVVGCCFFFLPFALLQKRTISRIVSNDRRRSKSSCSSKYIPSTRIRFRDGRTSKNIVPENYLPPGVCVQIQNLVQMLFHFTKAVGERHVCHSFFAKRAETFFFQQLTYLVETYLLFKVLWVYHGCKIQLIREKQEVCLQN